MSRITSKKFNYRPSKELIPNKKVFFAFEGLQTEKLYFLNLVKFSKINSLVPLYFYRDKNSGSSNPNTIVNNIIESIYGQEGIQPTYKMAAQIIFSHCKEKNIAISEQKVESYVQKFVNQLNVTINQPLLKDKLVEFIDFINEKISCITLQNSVLDEDFSKILEYFYTFDPELDDVYIVCDRDQHSFVDEQYDDSLEKCRKHKLNLIVTNPCIEFWFLLHYTDCKEYDESLILDNKKENDKTYVYRLLKSKDSTYNKNYINVEKYHSFLNIALENSKKYSSDSLTLKNNIGTMIPYVLKKLDIV